MARSWLDHLKLEYNILRGTLPDIIGSLAALKLLLVTENDLSGALPASVGFLTVMDTLLVRENLSSGKKEDHKDKNVQSVIGTPSAIGSAIWEALHLRAGRSSQPRDSGAIVPKTPLKQARNKNAIEAAILNRVLDHD